MTQPLLLAIDQGTTSSRAIAFDRGGRAVAVAQHPFAQHYPQDGWVEHDAEDIWRTTLAASREVLARCAGLGEVIAIGIANQRETAVLWERDSGRAICNAIVWQDRRTAPRCAQLERAGVGELVRAKTGLLLDAYFSAPKIAWMLKSVAGARRRAEAGALAFGTIDSFLIARLTAQRAHLTDATNASRTLLFDIHARRWDDELLRAFDLPAALLPQVRDCAAEYGDCDARILGRAIPIRGVAGDQQAALIGQACFAPGAIKSTYGTGCFLMLNTGARAVRSNSRLLTTLAYQLAGAPTYALEGSIFNAGTAIQWLRDVGVLESVAQIDSLLAQADEHDDDGVHMVPAFTGLGAPHWDADARGAIFGLTRDSSRAQLVRAAVAAAGHQTRDLLEAMRADWGGAVESLRVDGGMAANDWLAQFLADLLAVAVERPAAIETTSLGAAYLAGLQSGLYDSLEQISAARRIERRFTPRMTARRRAELIAGWNDALRRVRSASA